MNKRIWIIGTFGTGIILCIFGNTAFAVVGVLLGIASMTAGVFFIGGYKKEGFLGFSEFFNPYKGSAGSSSSRRPARPLSRRSQSESCKNSSRRSARSGMGFNGIMGFIGSIKGGTIIIGAGLIVTGVLLIVLCIFVESVAFFLGGIITLAAGIILLPLCGKHHRLIMPFCFACMAIGILMLFAPAFIWWISVALGVGLVIFSGILLMLMN